MNTTFAKTKKWLMVLLVALAVVAITATVLLVTLTGANDAIVTVASESDLNEAIAKIEQGTYGSDTILKLKQNISLESSLASNCTYTLDLNGHALSYAGSQKAPVITVSEGNLTLINSAKTNGKVTGGTDGGIVVNGGALALNGGAITGNTTSNSAHAGGIYVAEGSKISVAGAPVVADNTANGVASNLYLPGSTNVSVGDLSAAAQIGVTLDSKRVFTAGYSKSSAGEGLMVQAFTVDNSELRPVMYDNEIMVVADTDVVSVDGMPFDSMVKAYNYIDTLSEESATLVKLLNNTITTETLGASISSLTIDLNGYMLSFSNKTSAVFLVSTGNVERMVFTLMDSRANSEEVHDVANPLSTNEDDAILHLTGGVISGGGYGINFADKTTSHYEFYFQGGTIVGAQYHGLNVAAQNQNSMIHLFGGANIIYNKQFGIYSKGCKSISAQESVISHNGYGGITVDNAAITVSGAEISGNGITKDTSNSDVTISKTGIYIINSTSKLTVYDTKLDNNVAQGIYVLSTLKTATADIVRSSMSHNGSQGLNFTGSIVKITNGTFDHNGNTGITMTANQLTVNGSTARDNGAAGMSLVIPNVTINDTHVDRNKGDGVTVNMNTATLFSSTGSSFSSNTARGITYTGAAATPVTLESATISNNGTEGIYTNGLLTMNASDVESNGKCGIYYTSTTLKVTASVVSHNGKNYQRSATDQDALASNIYAGSAVYSVLVDGCTLSGATYRAIKVVGAKNNNFKVEVLDCSIFDNGGGVDVQAAGGVVNVDSCTIFDNAAPLSEGGGLRVLFNEAVASSVTLNKINLSENTSPKSGGGLFLSLVPTVGNLAVSLTEVYMNDCHATGYGGGAYIYLKPTTGKVDLTMKDVTTDRNVATNHGGGTYIYAYASKGQCDVTLQKISSDNNVTPGIGGGMYFYAASLTGISNVSMSDMSLDDNTSTYTKSAGGGGLYVYSYTQTGTGVLNMDTITMNRNSAVFNGGGAFVDVVNKAGGATVNWKNVQADDNLTNASYGGVYMNFTTTKAGDVVVKMDHASMSRNTAVREYGGLYINVPQSLAKGVTIDLNELHVDKNVTSTGQYAGAYFMAYSTAAAYSFSLKNSTLNDNVSYSNFGGLYVLLATDAANVACSFTIDTVTVNGNYANGYGGGYINAEAATTGDTLNVNLNELTVDGNTVYGNHYAGMFIHFNGIKTLTTKITDITFSNNTVELYTKSYGGGRFELFGGTANTTIDGFNVDKNWAGASYGGVFIYMHATTNTLSMTNAKVTNNRSDAGNCAGVFFQGNTGTTNVTIDNSLFDGNVSSFRDKETAGMGGAIYIQNDANAMNVKLGQNVTISNNSAVRGGGLYMLENSASTLNVTMGDGVVIKGNYAESGAGVFVYNYAKATSGKNKFIMEGGLITQNTAVEGGGVATYSDVALPSGCYNTFKMTGGVITDNHAEVGGGVSSGRYSTIELSGKIDISGNYKINAGRNNLFIYADNKVTIAGALDNSSVVYLSIDSVYNGRVLTTGYGTYASDFAGFKQDKSEGEFVVSGKELIYQAPSTSLAPILRTTSAGAEVQAYNDFATAFAAIAGTTDILKLRSDVTVSKAISVTKAITIDLNGYMLQAAVGVKLEPLITISANVAFTVKDSSYDEDGNSDSVHYLVSGRSFSLVPVYGGVIHGMVKQTAGTFNLQAGNVANGSQTAGFVYGVEVVGGTFNMGANAGICCNTSYGLYYHVDKGTLNVKAGKFFDNNWGIVFAPLDANSKSSTGTFNISGTVDVYNNQHGVHYNATGGTFNLSGGQYHDNIGYGIQSTGAGASKYTGGESFNNAYGLNTAGTAVVTITNISIHDNRLWGWYLTNKSAATFSGGEIYNEDFAIKHYAATSPLTISGGRIHDNRVGIHECYVDLTTAETTIKGTVEIYDNDYGVLVEESYAYQNTWIPLAMAGGTIRNNRIAGVYITHTVWTATAVEGGGVFNFLADAEYTNVWRFTMTGGSIINNDGYGVYLNAFSYLSTAGKWLRSNGQMEMTGGTISGNKGGGVYLVHGGGAFSKLYISGTPIIQNNTYEGQTRNVYSEYRGAYFNFVNNTIVYAKNAQVYVNKALSANARVGITLNMDENVWAGADNIAAFGQWATANVPEGTIFTDDPLQCLSRAAGKLYLSHGTAMTFHKQQDPTCSAVGYEKYYSCDTCGQKYVSEELREVYDPSEHTIDTIPHDFQWKTTGNDNHILTCTVCKATTGDAQAHNFTKFAVTNATTGTFTATCGDCGQTVNRTHAAGDNSSWQHVMAEGGLIYHDNATHEIFCIICKQNIVSEHAFDGVWLQGYGSGGHYQTCIICKLAKPVLDADHDLDGEWVKQGDGKHYQTCRACGDVIEIAEQDHILGIEWINREDIRHWKQCLLCDGYYEITTQPHKYYTKWYDAGDGMLHKVKCDLCTYEKTEAHTYNETWTSSEAGSKERPCTVCGYVQTDVCKHEQGTLTHDKESHWMVCSLCGDEYEQSEHHYAADRWSRDTVSTHIGYCTECGQYKTELHVAAGGYDNANYNDDYHYQLCALCNAEMNFEKHVYSWVEASSGEANYYDGTCIVCERQNLEQNHVFRTGAAWKSNETEHWRECTLHTNCPERFNIQPHDISDVNSSENGHGGGTCKDCGYGADPGIHIYGSYTYDENNPEKGHFRVCSVCGWQDAADQGSAHTDPRAFYNETEHGTWCSVCHYEFTHEEHTTSFVEGEDGHYAQCSGCKYVSNTVDHVWDRNYHTNNEQHYQQCTVCFATGNYTDHTNEYIQSGNNGHYERCKICSWRSTTTNPHEYGDKYYPGTNGHYQHCEKCGYDQRAMQNHVYSADYITDLTHHWQICELCGGTSEHEGHVFTSIIDNENDTHSTACAVCSRVDASTPCTYELYSKGDSASHILRCSTCRHEKYQEHDQNKANFDDEQHWKECSVCSYVEDSDKIDHVLDVKGTPTEDNSKHVFKCNNCDYTEEQEHTFSGDYRANDDGHWQLCSACGVADQSAPHVFTQFTKNEPLGSGKHTSTCDICSRTYEELECVYEFGTKGEHTGYCRDCEDEIPEELREHEYNIPKHDGENHWLECECGAKNEESKQPHSMSKTATEAENGHNFQCEGCEYTEFGTHNFDETNYQAANSNSTHHWKVCSACGARSEEEEHVITTATPNGNGTHSTQCDECSRRLLSVECSYGEVTDNGADHSKQCQICLDVVSEGHLYNLRDYSPEKHWMMCECGAINAETEESHVWGSSYADEGGLDGHYTPCTECEYVTGLQDHNYEGSKYGYNGTEHWRTCNDCGTQSGHSGHEISASTPNGNGTHSAECDLCEYRQTAAPCTYEYVSKDAEKHVATCTICHDVVEKDHQFNTHLSSKTQHWTVCGDCGKMDGTKEAHSWGKAIKAEGGHYFRCENEFCGYTTEVAAHNYKAGKWSENETGHWQVCEDCGQTTDVYGHSFGNATSSNSSVHAAKCLVCGRSDSEAHTFIYEQNDQQHTTKCAKCDYVKAEDHKYDGYVYDEDGHWKECSDCGYVDTTTQGEHQGEGEQCETCGRPSDDPYLAEKRAAIARLEQYVSDLGIEDISEANAKRIQDALRKAKNAINAAESVQAIEQLEKACYKEIDGIMLDEQKQAALDALEEEAERAKEEFRQQHPEMSEEELGKYEDAIDEALQAAKDAVNNAGSLAELEETNSNNESTFDDAILETGKEIASDKIDSDLEDAKRELQESFNRGELGDLTEEELQDLFDILDQEAERAKGKVENSTTLEEVEDEVKRGGDIIQDVVDNPDPELQGQKSEARDDLDREAQAKKDEIDQMVQDGKLTPEEGEELKKAVDQANGQAQDNVTEAETSQDVTDAKQEGLGDIEESGTYECQNKCQECGGCLTPNCGHEACQNKCQGHGGDQPDDHKCTSKCPTCEKCTNLSCDKEACKDKCDSNGNHEEPEDPVEKAKRESKAESTIQKDSALAKVAGATDGKYATAINAAWSTYLSKLEAADTVQKVEDAEAEFISAIKDILLEYAQDSAIAELESKRAEAKKALDDMNLDATEREKYEDAIDAAIDAAKDKVEKATDPDSIQDVLGEIDQKVDDAILNTSKEIAQGKIQDEADRKMQDIQDKVDSGEIDPEDGKKLQDIIQDEADRAKGNIESAGSRDEVLDEQKRGDEIMQDIVDNPDPELQGQKSGARDELEDQAKRLKDEIQKEADAKKAEVDNDPTLTDEQKQAKKDEIQREADRKKAAIDAAVRGAKDDVTKAEDSESVKDAVEKGKDSIDKAGKDPVEKNFFEKMMDFFDNTPLPLGIVGITGGAMIVLMMILSIAARKPKKK